jgi:REP element-mobilizing transposase RayT
MPRRNVNFAPGEIYHLFNRGVSRPSIFLSPENYHFFIAKCWSYSSLLDISILAICLMPNHYHLVVRQNSDHRAGKLPVRVCNSYAKAFNNSMNRTGALFEGRYQAKHVGSQAYLERLCAYVHLNPVFAQLVSEPEHWPYSDYHRWITGISVGHSMDIHQELGLCQGMDYREIVGEVYSEKVQLKMSIDESSRHPASAGDLP